MILQLKNLTEFNEILVEGVKQKNDGNLNLAESYLFLAKSMNDSHWQPYYEISKIYEIKKNYDVSFNFALESLKRTNGDLLAPIEKCLYLILVMKNRKLLKRIYDHINIYDHQVSDCLKSYCEAYLYSKSYTPKTREKIYSRVVDKSLGWIESGEVIHGIKDAILNNTPYCFIRLGDGEGTWLYSSIQFEMKFHTLGKRNRLEFWRIWFGEDIANFDNFRRIAHKIALQINQADLLGIPPKSWINHEFEICSLRGMPGTQNILNLLDLQSITKTKLCTQLMHSELSKSDDFLNLVKNLKELYVISCHPGIKEFFQNFLGSQRVHYIPIPGEPSRAHLHGNEVTKGVHFPDTYDSIVNTIQSSDWKGKICFVGAGILGKSYALQIKQQGGIAIDLGSMMDKWMGKQTRNFGLI